MATMKKRYVRICPVCDTENPPDQVHCGTCLSLLSGVDFSLPREVSEPAIGPEAAGQAEPEAPAPAPEYVSPDAPTDPNAAVPASVRQPTPPASPPLRAVPETAAEPVPALKSPEEDAAATADMLAPTLRISVDNAAAAIRCPAPDCGQYNPLGTTRCLYCNTLLPEPPPATLTFRPSLRMRMTGADANPALELDMPSLEKQVPTGSFRKEARKPRASLPDELASRFKVVKELQAAGSEADLFIVDPLSGGDSRIVKLYRRGIQPDSSLLARLSSVGSHVVKIFEFGVSDGLTWELMEYCRIGNLRTLMEKKILNQGLLRQIVQELSAALREIHARRILHRDLKPENILIRQLQPLSLALTDFGISSLSEGTRHFTDGARTVRYASPEALTGLIDAKTDWWSMGMILLEAASGRHPFAGLSEHVVNHHLATRPIEIKGVADDNFARLCRGLLLRDPSARWGGNEVERWLQGDPTLIAPRESGAEMVRPYRIGKQSAKTAEQLALALAGNWPEGVRDLRRGMILDWVRRELQDFELTRQLTDILEIGDDSDDRRLLRFILIAAPKIPPVWLGQPAHLATLVSRAKQAMKEGQAAEEAKAYLDSLFANDVLDLFISHGQAEMQPLNEVWRQGLVQVCRIWEAIRKESRHWQHRPRKGQSVNFDNMVYGLRDEIPRFPARKEWNPLLILSLAQHGFLAVMEQELRQTAEEVVEDVPWFTRLVAHLLDTPAGEGATPNEKIAHVLVGYRLQETARRIAQTERQERKKEIEAREKAVEALRQEIVQDLVPLAILDEDRLDGEAREEMRQLLDKFQTNASRIVGLSYPEESFIELTQQLSKLQYTASRLYQSLNHSEDSAEHRVFQLMTFPKRPHGLLGVLALAVLVITRFFPWLMAALGIFTLFRYLRHRRLQLALKHQIRAFQRHIKRFSNSQLPRHPLLLDDEEEEAGEEEGKGN
jgi:serine/threonine protein kinase/Skp family chaperone for outer membrane proteins